MSLSPSLYPPDAPRAVSSRERLGASTHLCPFLSRYRCHLTHSKCPRARWTSDLASAPPKGAVPAQVVRTSRNCQGANLAHAAIPLPSLYQSLSPRLPPTHPSPGPRWHGQSGPTLSGNLCFTVQARNTPHSFGLSPEFQGMSQPQAVLCQWWEQDPQLWALVPLTSLQVWLLPLLLHLPPKI